jgi:hypothetical protein
MPASHPTHVENVRLNFKELERLVSIHVEVAGAGPGYKSDVEVLNKSAIVLLVACWEAFVEDLVSFSFDFLLQNATSHTVFPNSVLTYASKSLKEANDERQVWELAGTGWQAVLRNHKVKTLSKYLDNFNTPRAENVDALFQKLIGLSQLSSCWSWKGMPHEDAKLKLSELVTLRGSIAHRVAASQTVYKRDVISYMDFIRRLTVKTCNQARLHIHDRIDRWPWENYRYGHTK